ncbi:LOW QUALITY PROTEIN: osteoclast stimulatory transmembrane protein [Choloepus didactylus]|uniref:LOW QUALITY PROTEIN: osteoclast stimulatory transmembrane protein n=1 Tax=Choloepus didactylus TaxID=27675 RepID=UPI00189FC39C|nr:LOW QUALITY PROTEIN: osteoclast stimulatory transmembrane protein [Choloepus didactylus]
MLVGILQGLSPLISTVPGVSHVIGPRPKSQKKPGLSSPGLTQAKLSAQVRGSRWSFWHSGLCKVLALLQASWDAFSRPVPASCGQLLTQLLLCGSLAASAAGLAHHWLVSSLLYPLGPSAVVATVCGLLVFLGLGLVPPARCLFALSVPTLGTEQGRRLLLSCSAATLAVTVVPNVLVNVGAAGRVLRCVTEGSLESLLNTTHRLHAASRALGPADRVGGRGLTFEVQGNGSAIRLHMLRATQKVLEDFSDMESLSRAVALGTQRMVAGVFVLGLLVESAWYLHHYLTNLHFDNIYATQQLARQLAEARATHLVASPPAWLLWATQPRLSREELLHCLLRLGLLTPLLVATAVTVATDHMAFLLAQAAVDWAQKLPTVPVTLTVKYDVAYTVLAFLPFLFGQQPAESPLLSAHSSSQWELRLTAPGCPLLPAQHPRAAGPLAAAALQLLACSTVLLETYARRLRHAIAASFFTAQEARRARHLHARLQHRYARSHAQQLRLGEPSCSGCPGVPASPPRGQMGLPHAGHRRTQGSGAERSELCSRSDLSCHPGPSTPSWVTLGRSLHLSEPLFLRQHNGCGNS